MARKGQMQKGVKRRRGRRKGNGTGRGAEGSGRGPRENLAEKRWEVTEGEERMEMGRRGAVGSGPLAFAG